MEVRPYTEDSTMLYEAAMRGCITTLRRLIQKDQLILNKVSLTHFTETPLHISALLGHLDFTIAILERCPKMASECDSLRRFPLHLASAEGHTQIVKALLIQDKDVCLARDQDGRTPLHLAAMRGRVEAIQELTIRYLLSLPEVKERLNNLNGMGLTALDLSEQCPRDFKSLEIRRVLMEAGAERAVKLNSNLSPQPTSAIISIAPETAVNSTKRSEANHGLGNA
ncbi:hypothetical protein GH714_019252 [Hevea brasiliensis]|uniref:Uncharacterized protein n=1 Tax=Hevea brasiliensis TaxID=3981 RepID=A0A6A6LHS6_HEVBR|nr:hypothetical protein GH714_019252 [Hevea brasiliensis]